MFKINFCVRIAMLFALLANIANAGSTPLGTAFTYQGRLLLSGAPVDDSADFEFTLFDAATVGDQIGGMQPIDNVDVVQGNFIVSLDFGAGIFIGDERWLQIAVRVPHDPTDTAAFTTLSPRQRIDSAPYALFALQAALSGTYGQAVSFTNAANSLSGNGAGLTSLGAANLTGTIGGGLLSGSYSNPLTFSNAGNSFTGTHTGNGAALTSLNASNLASGNLAAARLPTGGAWSLSSNLNLDSNTLVVDQANNRVGIGTASPGVPLEVAGLARFTGTGGFSIGSDPSRNRISTTGAGGQLFALLDTSNGYTGLRMRQASVGASFGDVNAPANGMIVQGSVGIGTSTPVQALDVAGSSGAAATSGSGPNGIIRVKPSATSAVLDIGGTGSPAHAWLQSRDADNYFTDYNLALNPNGGNVGIGTASPTDRLHVLVNSATAAGAIIENTGVSGDAQLLIKTSFGVGRDSQVVFDTNSSNTGVIRYDGGRFNFDTGGVTRMQIDNFGQVGIGTVTPFSPLDIRASNVGTPYVNIENTGTTGFTTLRISTNNPTIGPELVLDGTTPGVSAGIRYDDNADGIIRFFNGGDYRMVIDSAGNVGIGDVTPDVRLDVEKLNNTVAVFNRTGSDGTVISIQQAGTQEGSISVSGSTVSYNAFTGSHYGWIADDQSIDRFALVRMTGENQRLRGEKDSEVIYGIEPTTRANDPACLGAYLGLQESSHPASDENPHLIMAVGNGEIFVVQSHAGDIHPGDYLISSDAPGCAMKDDPQRFARGYIVARAAERVDWSTVRGDDAGIKRAKISVLFESFVRDHSEATRLARRVAQLEAEIQSFKIVNARLARLEHLLDAQESATNLAFKETTR